jgi:hypothetical protein
MLFFQKIRGIIEIQQQRTTPKKKGNKMKIAAIVGLVIMVAGGLTPTADTTNGNVGMVSGAGGALAQTF